MGCQRLRGEDSTGGARLSILIYTQIITLAYSSPFFITPLLLFPGKCSLRLSHQLQTALFSSAVPRHLSVLYVWYSNSQMSIRGGCCFVVPHSFLLGLSVPSITFSHIHWLHIFLCLCPAGCQSLPSLFLSLGVSVNRARSLPLLGPEAEVLDSQRRSTGLNDGLVNGVTDNSAN